jgi:putative oxidoreductase
MWQKLVRTDANLPGMILRLTLGIVIFPHGAQKVLGWWGGGGFSATLEHMPSMFGLPAFVVFLVMIGEFFGSLGLIVGFLTRFCAVAIGLIMAGAMAMVHWGNGFFMNWGGNQAGEGFEYHLLAIGIVLTLLATGGGKASVDGALTKG